MLIVNEKKRFVDPILEPSRVQIAEVAPKTTHFDVRAGPCLQF